jgi:hypothetical protein
MHAHVQLDYTLLGLPLNNKATALQNRCFHARSLHQGAASREIRTSTSTLCSSAGRPADLLQSLVGKLLTDGLLSSNGKPPSASNTSSSRHLPVAIAHWCEACSPVLIQARDDGATQLLVLTLISGKCIHPFPFRVACVQVIMCLLVPKCRSSH